MCFIFAPAFASKTADSEKGSQKIFLKKKFPKYLVVSKIVLTFAPLSALKFWSEKTGEWFFDLLVFILREKV